MSSFSWIPVYKELGQALLLYRSRQGELINVLQDLSERGYNVISLEDRRGEEAPIPLTEIDPFTFFAAFNRATKDEARLDVIAELKERFDLNAAVPEDLDGIPTVLPQSSWFFGWSHMRNEGDFPALWDLAECAVQAQAPGDLDIVLFDRCLTIRAVGMAKLTMGLFWIQPDLFLPLDAKTREYLSQHGHASEVADGQEYMRLLEEVQAQHSESFAEISHSAYLAPHEASEEPGLEEAGSAADWGRKTERSYHVWLLAPGREAQFWEDWVERGIIAIGWDALGDLSQYESKKAVAEAMRVAYESEHDPSNNSLACWAFMREMKEGDLVFIKEGTTTLRGAGKVTSGYRYLSGNGEQNRHIRGVEWHRTGTWTTLPHTKPGSWWDREKKTERSWRSEPRVLPQKTLTDITGYRSMVSELEICMGLGRTDVVAGVDEALPIRPDVLDAAIEQVLLPQVDAGVFEDPALEGYLRQEVLPKAQEALLPEAIKEDPAGAVRRALNAHGNLLHATEIAKATGFLEQGDPDDVRRHVEDLLRGSGDVEARARRFLEWAGRRKGPGGNTIGFNGTVTSYLMAMHSPATCAFCKPSVYNESANRLLGPEQVAGPEDEARRIAHATRFYRDVLHLMRRPQYDLPYRDLLYVHSSLWVLANSMQGFSHWEDLKTDETAAVYTLRDAARDLFYPRETFDRWLQTLRAKKNLVLQGPPGVGKTFVARRIAYALMEREDERRVRMVQFHQSYAYEDFIQGFRPHQEGGFVLQDGVFYRFCRRAQMDERQPYVFIIDEINRGNLSKILGELMMLIEPDKRGADYAVPLTYQREGAEPFYVPENLYLIGMMNTADRSLAMVDYALRRRFAFVDMEPRFTDSAFEDYLRERGAGSALIDRIVREMTGLNDEIAADTTNLGPGFRVGHSYFCPADGVAPDEDWYTRVIKREIAPLLREYWFDDLRRAERRVDALLA